MEWGLEQYFVIALLAFFTGKVVLIKTTPWANQLKPVINVILFLAIAVFLVIKFWREEIYIGLFAVFLGTLAFGKYFYDVYIEE